MFLKKIKQLIQITITVIVVAQNKDKLLLLLKKQLLLLLLLINKTKCQDNTKENLEVGCI